MFIVFMVKLLMEEEPQPSSKGAFWRPPFLPWWALGESLPSRLYCSPDPGRLARSHSLTWAQCSRPLSVLSRRHSLGTAQGFPRSHVASDEQCVLGTVREMVPRLYLHLGLQLTHSLCAGKRLYWAQGNRLSMDGGTLTGPWSF